MSCNEGRSDSVRRCAASRRRRARRASCAGVGRHDSGRRSRATTPPTSPCRRSAILGSTAVVTWEQDTSPSTEDIVSDTFQTSPANDVANGVPGKAADGWASVDRTQALVPTTTGGLAIAFGGIHSTNSADPLIGLIGATHNADGSWTAPTTIATGEGTGQRLVGRAERRRADLRRQRRGQRSASSSTRRRRHRRSRPISSRSSGPARTATSRSSRSTRWGDSGSPGTRSGHRPYRDLRAAARPDDGPARSERRRSRRTSDNIDNNSFGTALACAATCRLVYGDAPAGTSTNLLVSWWIGQATPTTIANLADTGQTAGRVVADAYRSDGRLWIAWWNGKTYSYVLGDATGAGGSVQDAGAARAAATRARTR